MWCVFSTHPTGWVETQRASIHEQGEPRAAEKRSKVEEDGDLFDYDENGFS